MCPSWWNRVPLVFYMPGSSGLTATHSGATCYQRCHVPCTFRNPSVVFYVFYRSRNRVSWLQEAQLPSRSHLSLLPLAIQICQPPYPCAQSHFSFHIHRLDIAEILLLGRQTPKINQSVSHKKEVFFFLWDRLIYWFIDFYKVDR